MPFSLSDDCGESTPDITVKAIEDRSDGLAITEREKGRRQVRVRAKNARIARGVMRNRPTLH